MWTDTSNVQGQIVPEWRFDEKVYDSAVHVSRLAGMGVEMIHEVLQRH